MSLAPRVTYSPQALSDPYAAGGLIAEVGRRLDDGETASAVFSGTVMNQLLAGGRLLIAGQMIDHAMLMLDLVRAAHDQLPDSAARDRLDQGALSVVERQSRPGRCLRKLQVYILGAAAPAAASQSDPRPMGKNTRGPAEDALLDDLINRVEALEEQSRRRESLIREQSRWIYRLRDDIAALGHAIRTADEAVAGRHHRLERALHRLERRLESAPIGPSPDGRSQTVGPPRAAAGRGEDDETYDASVDSTRRWSV